MVSRSRRRFLRSSLALAGLGLVAGCGVRVPWAEPQPRPRRIGWLAFATADQFGNLFDALREGLRDLGYLEGQILLVEARWAENQASRLPQLAQELVELGPEVIVTQADAVTQAVTAATSTIPIVAVSVSDPVGLGIAASLAHPGGNVTGLTLTTRGQAAKRLQLLQEVSPTASRVAFFYYPGSARDRADLAEAQEAAPQLKLTLLPLPVSAPADFEPAFAQALALGADSASFHAGTLGGCCVPQIVSFPLQHRIPAMHAGRPQGPDHGGADELRRKLHGQLPPGGGLRRQDPQGRQARRHPLSGPHQVGVRHQPQDRPSARVDDPGDGPAPGDRDYRVDRSIARRHACLHNASIDVCQSAS